MQNVATLSMKLKVVSGMMGRMRVTGMEKRKMLKDARQMFPAVFRTSPAANRERAQVYYAEAEQFLLAMSTERKSITTNFGKGVSISRKSAKAFAWPRSVARGLGFVPPR